MSKYKNDFVKRAETSFVDILERESRMFLDRIISEVGHGGESYENKTMNLYDSYGYAIYLDGHVLRSSTTKRTATTPRKWYGDEYFGSDILKEAFSNGGYKPDVTTGYVVVFGAFMPYGAILESGGGRLKRKYKVITFMEDEARKFGESSGLKGIVKDVKLGKYEV